MTNTRHLCIVAPSRKMGGIERALAVIANESVKKGLKVTYISCLKGHAFYELSDQITVFEFQGNRAGGIVNKLLFYPRLILFIRRAVLAVQPDAVLSFGDVFNPLVILALLGKKIPVFISDRTSPDYNFPAYIQKLKKLLYPKATGFVAQSQVAANYKIKHFQNKLKIQIIPNAVRKINKYSNVDKQNIILFAGRFAWEKDPLILVDAFKLIVDQSNYNLVLAGDGPQREEVIRKVADYGLSDRVELIGEQRDIDYQFARAKIYVLPSVLEGFPNALAEAMSAGLAVVCFDTIPYQELIINSENGLVVPRTAQALGGAIQKLIDDPELAIQMGDKAAEIGKQLDAAAITQKYLNFIFQDNG